MKHKTIAKRIIDIALTSVLLCLMAYQVTGEFLHEWLGIGMTVLVIVHQILNRKWYSTLFKGKYKAYRILQTVINGLLLLSFALTAFCGMAMSAHAVPFLYGMVPVSFARQMHLSLSHWSFVLMGLHIGLHIPMMTAKGKLSQKTKNVLNAVFCFLAGIGLYFFLKNNMHTYLVFSAPFAFLDYEASPVYVFIQNIAALLFWAFLGTQVALLSKSAKKRSHKQNIFNIVIMIVSVLIGSLAYEYIPSF
ncbi:MAG: DUF4405 domain-containing protein [Clostridia bacterium]|nr:DUF4405 domain-containing protein [Clostridia bacterium]